MSNTEKLALKLLIPKQVDDIEELCRFYYIKGYHQAEKDLALTWKDIADIENITTEILKECDNKILYDTEEGFYQEVLNRFNKWKGRL